MLQWAKWAGIITHPSAPSFSTPRKGGGHITAQGPRDRESMKEKARKYDVTQTPMFKASKRLMDIEDAMVEDVLSGIEEQAGHQVRNDEAMRKFTIEPGKVIKAEHFRLADVQLEDTPFNDECDYCGGKIKPTDRTCPKCGGTP